VTLQSSDGRMIAQTITDDRGLFRLPQGKAGTYALVACNSDIGSALM
jgi:hypothetical protein